MTVKTISLRRVAMFAMLMALMTLAMIARPALANDPTYTLGWAADIDQYGNFNIDGNRVGGLSATIDIDGLYNVPYQTAIPGKTVTVLANANTGYEPTRLFYQSENSEPTDINFTPKTISGGLYYEGTFTMPAANTVIGAVFAKKTYTVTIDIGSKHEGFVQRYFAGKEGVTVDGSKVMLTVKHETTTPQQIAQSLYSQLTGQEATFVDNNEFLMTEYGELLLGKHQRSEYQNKTYYDRSQEGFYSPITSDMTLHALWAPPVGDFTLTLTSCKCGDVLEYQDLSQPIWTPKPYQNIEGNVTIFNDDHALYSGYNIDKPENSNTFTLQGGNSYSARVYIAADWGYFLPDNFADSMTVVNGKYENSDVGGVTYRKLNVSIPVKHIVPEDTKVLAPTCTVAGWRKYQCTGCNTEITETTEPLGHTWGEWTQTKAPTCTEEGIEERVCTRDTSHKETQKVAIDLTAHNWGEPTYTWSGDNATCTATRSCKNNASHVETEVAQTTSTVTREPTATEAGTRTYTATFNNAAFATQTKDVEIPATGEGDAGATYTAVAGANVTWTKGSGTDATVTIKRTEDDDTTFAHFSGITMDGKEVPADQYRKQPGSVVITLPAAYLETLSVGEHALVAKFDDGSVATKLTVQAAATPTPTDPDADPTDPDTDPTKPSTDPSKPSTDPAKPSTDPANPNNTGTSTTPKAHATPTTSTPKTALPKTADESSAPLAASLVGVAALCFLAARGVKRA